LGKSAFSAPQSEMAGALLACRMEQKIKQELFNVSLSPPTFIGDSEIVLKMIAKNDPAGNPYLILTNKHKRMCVTISIVLHHFFSSIIIC